MAHYYTFGAHLVRPQKPARRNSSPELDKRRALFPTALLLCGAEADAEHISVQGTRSFMMSTVQDTRCAETSVTGPRQAVRQ